MFLARASRDGCSGAGGPLKVGKSGPYLADPPRVLAFESCSSLIGSWVGPTRPPAPPLLSALAPLLSGKRHVAAETCSEEALL